MQPGFLGQTGYGSWTELKSDIKLLQGHIVTISSSSTYACRAPGVQTTAVTRYEFISHIRPPLPPEEEGGTTTASIMYDI